MTGGPATRTPISTASIGFDSQYRVWHADLWSAVAATLGIATVQRQPAAIGSRLSISMVNRQLTNPVVLSCEATSARVTENRELSAMDPYHQASGPPDTLRWRCPMTWSIGQELSGRARPARRHVVCAWRAQRLRREEG